MNDSLEIVCSFSIFDWATFLSMMSYLCETGLWATAIDRMQVSQENQCTTGNEGGRV